MFVHNIQNLEEASLVAARIGGQQGLDFSFLIRINGKVLKATAEHIRRGQRLLADIRPASRYGAQEVR
jgi:hypothetical protein